MRGKAILVLCLTLSVLGGGYLYHARQVEAARVASVEAARRREEQLLNEQREVDEERARLQAAVRQVHAIGADLDLTSFGELPELLRQGRRALEDLNDQKFIHLGPARDTVASYLNSALDDYLAGLEIWRAQIEHPYRNSRGELRAWLEDGSWMVHDDKGYGNLVLVPLDPSAVSALKKAKADHQDFFVASAQPHGIEWHTELVGAAKVLLADAAIQTELAKEVARSAKKGFVSKESLVPPEAPGEFERGRKMGAADLAVLLKKMDPQIDDALGNYQDSDWHWSEEQIAAVIDAQIKMLVASEGKQYGPNFWDGYRKSLGSSLKLQLAQREKKVLAIRKKSAVKVEEKTLPPTTPPRRVDRDPFVVD